MTESSEEFKVGPSGPSRIFVEIGFGWDPAFLGGGSNEDRREYFRDTHYIGVEHDPFIIQSAKNTIHHKQLQGEVDTVNPTDHLLSIGFNVARISELPIPEGMVDEVYLANVLAETINAQEIFTHGLDEFRMKGAIAKSPNARAKQEALLVLYPVDIDDPRYPFSAVLADIRHVRKLLKPEGQLTIVETNTPANPEHVALIVGALGYEIEEMIFPYYRERWAEIQKLYHIQEGEIEVLRGEVPYVMIARPKK